MKKDVIAAICKTELDEGVSRETMVKLFDKISNNSSRVAMLSVSSRKSTAHGFMDVDLMEQANLTTEQLEQFILSVMDKTTTEKHALFELGSNNIFIGNSIKGNIL